MGGGGPLVSVVVTVRDGEGYLAEAMRSAARQTHRPLEVAVHDDGSCDGTLAALEALRPELKAAGVALRVSAGAEPRGIGHGLNRAVASSRGAFLCRLDADDVMAPERVALQLAAAAEDPERLLVGAGFDRGGDPAATPRYTAWANSLSREQLYLQQLRECTVIHPTWFFSRKVFDRVGGYDEGGPGTPEDLIFFYRHLELGGQLARCPERLLMWRFHGASVTTARAVHWRTIWDLRVRRLESLMRAPEPPVGGNAQLTIWNAGREGRRLFQSLPPDLQARVRAFCDVDPKKLARQWNHFTPPTAVGRVPVVHFSTAVPPLLLCVKGGLTGGAFEANLASLALVEGRDYLHFSF